MLTEKPTEASGFCSFYTSGNTVTFPTVSIVRDDKRKTLRLPEFLEWSALFAQAEAHYGIL